MSLGGKRHRTFPLVYDHIEAVSPMLAPFRMLSIYGSTREPRISPPFRVTYRNVEPRRTGRVRSVDQQLCQPISSNQRL